MSFRIEIKQPVLRWAVERTGLTPDELSKQADFHSVRKWLAGELNPTLKQAEKLARQASIPFGYLLMDEPVDDRPDIPDFRTVNSTQVIDFSPNLEEMILSRQSRLDWYVEFALAEGIPPPKLTAHFRLEDDPHIAVRELLNELDWFPGKSEPGRERLLTLSDALEDYGILVMRSAVVGNNNRRRLDKNEFRAFTLIKNLYALIFINADDAKVAQYFSLAHEVGHVLLGEAGITGNRNDHRRVERWCNRFAAEFLLPTEPFLEHWWRARNVDAMVDWTYKNYGVSVDATVWKLVDNGELEREEALSFLQAKPTFELDESLTGGGQFKYNMRSRLGSRFLDTVTGALADGVITQEEASQQIGVYKTQTIASLVEEFQGVA